MLLSLCVALTGSLSCLQTPMPSPAPNVQQQVAALSFRLQVNQVRQLFSGRA